ncbi:DJ-1/PfpI family protein [Streptomyces olivaceoviridis]
MTPTASTAPAGATPRVLVVVSAADRMVDLLHHDAFADDSLNEHFGALMQHFHDTGKPTGLICHAPAALAAAPAAGGRGIYDGYRMTCFKTIVDTLLETIPIARRFPPALKEDPARLLSARGAKVEQTWLPMGSKVVEDRELITGQDPYSVTALGKAFVVKVRAARG